MVEWENIFCFVICKSIRSIRLEDYSYHLIVLPKIQITYSVDAWTVFRLITYLLNEDHAGHLIQADYLWSPKNWFWEFMYGVLNVCESDWSFARSAIKIQIYSNCFIHYQRDKCPIHFKLAFFVSFLFLLANKLAVELSLRNALFRIINGKKRCDANGRCRVSSVWTGLTWWSVYYLQWREKANKMCLSSWKNR